MPESHRGTVILVANYAPDVGFAWWLMENFWIRVTEEAEAHDLASLIVYPEPGPVPDSIRQKGIETKVFPFPGPGLAGLVDSLRLIRRYRVRYVYLTDRAFTSPKYFLFRLAGVRIIVNHDHTPGDRSAIGGLRGALKSLWRRVWGASCDLQICVSPLIRERAITNARIPPKRAVVVQNGIEPITCQDNTYAHRVLGLPLSRSICITVGRAHSYKRIDFVIDVARRCFQLQPECELHFVFCGDGPDMGRLRRLVRDAELADRFSFTGRRTDVRQLLCSSDYAIHPAKGEAFSLAILEYMSAELAVLVPDIPTVMQAISDGETGLIFADGDVTAACQLLLKVHVDQQLRDRLGRAATREVRQNYSLTKMNHEFSRITQEMLDKI